MSSVLRRSWVHSASTTTSAPSRVSLVERLSASPSGVRSSASPTYSSSMSRRTTLTSRVSSGSKATSPAPRWGSYSSPTTATSSTASATRSSSSTAVIYTAIRGTTTTTSPSARSVTSRRSSPVSAHSTSTDESSSGCAVSPKLAGRRHSTASMPSMS